MTSSAMLNGDRQLAPGVIEMLPASETFELIDPSRWQDQEPPPREWMLDSWLPRRRAIYLTGAGGLGKSLLAQQLATCIAVGRPFFGVEVSQAPSIYLTAEDDYDELQRRQRAICRNLGIREADLQLKLFLVSLFGRPNNEMAVFDREHGLQESTTWQRLVNTANITFARFIVLDNVSHFFAGSEIDRAQVTAFANLLNGLSNDIDGGVMLIGHPNKQGDAYSGSTAWENAFRARLFLDASKAEGAHADPDVRQLTLPKANYARKGAAIDIRWYEGAFVREEDLPPSAAAEMRQVSAHTAANDTFLRCLDRATEQHRAVSHVPGANYAPKVFAGMTEGRGHTIEGLAGAMERLLHLKLIELDQPLWRGENRHWKQGIRRCSEAAPTPAPTPRQPPASTRANPTAKSLENMRQGCADPARQHPLSPTEIEGQAPWDLPSLSEEDLDWGAAEPPIDE